MAGTKLSLTDSSQDNMTSKSLSPAAHVHAQPVVGSSRTPAPVVPETHQRTPLWKIHALPAPIRTYPLPTFYPSNPLSLIHLVYTWFSQVVFPPALEPATVHYGTWSPKTRSVHITDPKSIRALWEQGFYGKGIFSRSEPNWLKKQQEKRASQQNVAELNTARRRAERKQMKWDRARKEQEAIQRTKFEEIRIAPVAPSELLAMPNSQHELYKLIMGLGVENGSTLHPVMQGSNLAEEQPLTQNSVIRDEIIDSEMVTAVNETSSPASESSSPFPFLNGHGKRPHTPQNKVYSPASNGSLSSVKRRKSVRFSPTVESATFQHSDPPSPSSNVLGDGIGKVPGSILTNGVTGTSPPSRESSGLLGQSPLQTLMEAGDFIPEDEASDDTVDKEHLQLTLEEAFFLSFGMGALAVKDETTNATIPNAEFFGLCRQYSYFPPKCGKPQPDDPFMVHYAVYHHYRSLGWVVRPGIKFGVDWLLYNRGPAFSHAEFAMVVLPSYSDPHWKAEGRVAPKLSWQQFFTVTRVQSQAIKTVILVYVDVPPPTDGGLDVVSLLKRYKIREVMVRRWSLNRNRD